MENTGRQVAAVAGAGVAAMSIAALLATRPAEAAPPDEKLNYLLRLTEGLDDILRELEQLGEGLPTFPPTLEQSLAELTTVAKRLAPDDLLWGIFPGDGGFELLPAGKTIIDFTSRQVTSPKGTVDLEIPEEVFRMVQSVAIFTDTLIYITASPGFGTFLTAGAIIEAPARKIDSIQVEADTPYSFLLVLGTGLDAPRARAVQLFQLRISQTTLAKVAAAGVADPLGNISFVPVSSNAQGVKTISQADFGVDFIRVPGWGTKTFIVRNVGPGAVEVQLFGSGTKTFADALGYVADTDTALTAIPAGGSATLESGIFYGLVQFRARVAAAEVAGMLATVVVEYSAIAPSMR